MYLHTHNGEVATLYTLLDAEERVVLHPTGYLGYLRRRHRAATSQRQIAHVIKQHCQWIERWKNFEDMTVDEALAVIDDNDILDWIDFQRAEAGLSESTINNRELLVRGMYRWLTTNDSGRVRHDIPWIEGAFTKQPHDKAPKFVTAEQVITLLSGTYSESQRVASHFIYDTGVRVSELARLTKSCLPDEDNWPRDVNYYPLIVPGSKPRHGHKVKKRYTILSKPVLARVRRYHASRQYTQAADWSVFDPDKPLFLNVHGGALKADSVRKTIKSAWRRKAGEAGSEKMSPHRLRHGCGMSVLLSEFGKDLIDNLVILKEMLGHESIHTTEIYASIPIAALQSVLGERKVRLRFQEADRIYTETYLPARAHTERRGYRA